MKFNKMSTAVTAATVGVMLAVAGCASNRTQDDIRAYAPQGDRDQQPLVAQAAPTDQSQLPDAVAGAGAAYAQTAQVMPTTTTSSYSSDASMSGTQTASSTAYPAATTTASSTAYPSGSTSYDNGSARPSSMDNAAATSSMNGNTAMSNNAGTAATSSYGNTTASSNTGSNTAGNSAMSSSYGSADTSMNNGTASDRTLAPRADRN